MWIDSPKDLLTDKDLMSVRVDENSSYYRTNNLYLGYKYGKLVWVEFEDCGENYAGEEIDDVTLKDAFCRFDCRRKFEEHEELLYVARAGIECMPSTSNVKKVREICENFDKTAYVEFGKKKFGKDVIVTPYNKLKEILIGFYTFP